MNIRVSYGVNQVLELESKVPVTVANPHGAEVLPIQDVDQAVQEVLAHPLELPPLAKCVTRSDRVILALKRGTPRGSEILAAVTRYLLPVLRPEGQLTILRTQLDEEMGRGDPRPYLSSQEREFVEVKTHRSDLEEDFALLARFSNGRPLRLHRALVDADVVIPVGWSQPGGAWGTYGSSGAVFPAFSDQMSQLFHWREAVRSANRDLSASDRQRYRRRQVGLEADWLLGMQFAIEVVPGPCESILKVVAGMTKPVAEIAHQDYQEWWCPTVDRKAELVIAGVDHDPSHTPWENLAQAAWSAARLVRRGGRIVLITHWDENAVTLTMNDNSLAEASGIWSWSEFLQRHGDRGVPFWLLARARHRASLCLWTAETLKDESLGGWRERLALETGSGITAIERLMHHANSCTVFSHASLTWPKVVRRKRATKECSETDPESR